MRSLTFFPLLGIQNIYLHYKEAALNSSRPAEQHIGAAACTQHAARERWREKSRGVCMYVHQQSLVLETRRRLFGSQWLINKSLSE